MDFECECNFRTKMVGDGCQICNTTECIDKLPTPQELAADLQQSTFSNDQAYEIAAEVYQPLLSLIRTLSYKIDQLGASR